MNNRIDFAQICVILMLSWVINVKTQSRCDIATQVFYMLLCFKVNATDKDTGPNAHVTYEFMAGTQSSFECRDDKVDDFPFEIDTLSGNISVTPSFVLLCARYSSFIKACDNPVVTANR